MTLGEVRDASVIILAIVAVLSTATALVAVAVLWRFVRMLKRELLPIIDTLSETASTLESAVNATVESRAGSALQAVLSTAVLQRILAVLVRRR